jgi:hypothetical protein
MIFNAGVSCHCNSHRMDTFADPRSKRREGVDYLPYKHYQNIENDPITRTLGKVSKQFSGQVSCKLSSSYL